MLFSARIMMLRYYNDEFYVNVLKCIHKMSQNDVYDEKIMKTRRLLHS